MTALTPAVTAWAAETEGTPDQVELSWLDDYASGWKQAREEQKMLLVYFRRSEGWAAQERFEKSLEDEHVRKLAREYVLVRVPSDAVLADADGQERKLLEFPAFRHMYGASGFAVIDLEHKGEPFYGFVTSAYPFHDMKWFTPASLQVIFNLPAGTLTQRSMIWAVRMHPERPASTGGALSGVLVKAAQSHSQHQASITLQGHHNWDSRFHQIRYQLARYQPPIEVCAESWPGKRLVDACIDCIDSWRQSPGHWNGVRSAHAVYGYDIKMGRNGIWYATGIFAD